MCVRPFFSPPPGAARPLGARRACARARANPTGHCNDLLTFDSPTTFAPRFLLSPTPRRIPFDETMIGRPAPSHKHTKRGPRRERNRKLKRKLIIWPRVCQFLLLYELIGDLFAFVGQKCRQNFLQRGKQLLNE